jgi:hypothetical protein
MNALETYFKLRLLPFLHRKRAESYHTQNPQQQK